MVGFFLKIHYLLKKIFDMMEKMKELIILCSKKNITLSIVKEGKINDISYIDKDKTLLINIPDDDDKFIDMLIQNSINMVKSMN